MSIYEKLLKLQTAVGAIGKDSKNPFFKSKYFDINKLLEVVKPELSKLGLVLLQPLSHIEGKSAIKTLLIDAETGETLADITPLTENPDPQKMGSAVTYFRRYSLQSLLGLQSEDDDGNKAAGNQVSKTANQAVKKLRKLIGERLSGMVGDDKTFADKRAVQDDMENVLKVRKTADCDDLDKLRDYYKYLEKIEKET